MGQLKSILQIHLTPILGVSWYLSFTPQSPNLYLTFEYPNPFLSLGFEMTQTQVCNEQQKTQSWYQLPKPKDYVMWVKNTIKWIV